jgi:hypothetical protein
MRLKHGKKKNFPYGWGGTCPLCPPPGYAYVRDGTSVFVPHASFLSRDNIGEIITDVAISSDIVL